MVGCYNPERGQDPDRPPAPRNGPERPKSRKMQSERPLPVPMKSAGFRGTPVRAPAEGSFCYGLPARTNPFSALTWAGGWPLPREGEK